MKIKENHILYLCNDKMEFNIYYIKPGNFIVLFNQTFNKNKFVTKMKAIVFIDDKEVFSFKIYNYEMIKY